MAKVSEPQVTRLSAHAIFEGVTENARSELARPTKALAFSGVAAGITMGITGMGVAIVRATVGDGGWQTLVAHMLYPSGFIAVIIGRAQLFTENTLYPVALVLEERRHVLNTLRLWSVVFFANVVGAAIFGWLTTRTGALHDEYVRELVKLGVEATRYSGAQVFATGIIGGWLIALVAWMVTASTRTIGQIAVVWLLAFIVGIGHFAHCIATSGEILASVWAGSLSLVTYIRWIIPATAGNIVGGIGLVTLLNYGQVRAGEND